MAIEFGLHLEGRTTEEITSEERETYTLKPGEVCELHFTGSHPVLSMERLETYMDKMLALKNDHPEFALLYLSLDLDEMPDKVKLVVQASALPTEEVVKPQIGPLAVAGYIGIIIAAAFFVKVAAPPTLEFMYLIRDFFTSKSAEQKLHEEKAGMYDEMKMKVDEDIRNLEGDIENKKLRLKEPEIRYNEKTGEILLSPEEIEGLPLEQQELIADYKNELRALSEKRKLSGEFAAKADKERKAAEEAGGKPSWWLIGGVLGVAGLAAATGLIRTLRKD